MVTSVVQGAVVSSPNTEMDLHHESARQRHIQEGRVAPVSCLLLRRLCFTMIKLAGLLRARASCIKLSPRLCFLNVKALPAVIPPEPVNSHST